MKKDATNSPEIGALVFPKTFSHRVEKTETYLPSVFAINLVDLRAQSWNLTNCCSSDQCQTEAIDCQPYYQTREAPIE